MPALIPPLAVLRRWPQWQRVSLTVLLTALSVVGCVRHAPGRSQVVVKVNDREITLSQLNQALDSADPEALTAEVTRHAIDSLVDEELLVQEALKNKLDRDPATVAALERARRQILAEAYAERMVYPRSPVRLAEEEKYYKDHPGLFENRRVYRLATYTIPQAQMNDILRSDLNATHSADQVRQVLEKHGIRYETQQMNAPAEDLPIDKVAEFAAASVGDLMIADQGEDKVLLISIVDVEPKPLAFEAAKAAIDQYLTKQRNNEAIQEHLKMDKAAADISYVGEFAQYGATARR
jgi:peptidyl-prolyl cis-trans isomerase C